MVTFLPEASRSRGRVVRETECDGSVCGNQQGAEDGIQGESRKATRSCWREGGGWSEAAGDSENQKGRNLLPRDPHGAGGLEPGPVSCPQVTSRGFRVLTLSWSDRGMFPNFTKQDSPVRKRAISDEERLPWLPVSVSVP